MNIVLYGLSSCDATVALRKELEKTGIEFTFHDIRKSGLDKLKLASWIRKSGWEKLLNKRSTTWKELPAEQKSLDLNEASALQLIMEHVTLMKRPVLEMEGNLLVGKEATLVQIKNSLKN